MKLVITIFILFLLVSCSKKIDGRFTVSKDMDFQKKSIWGNKKNLMIPIGEYNSIITLYKKDKIKFNIKDVNGEDKKIKFLIPDDISFPRYSGEVYLDSESSGQPFDLHAKVTSDVVDSDEYHGRENCSYTEYRNVCNIECHIVEGRQVCTNVCRRRPVTIYGSRSVTYYYTDIDTLYKVDFLEGSSQILCGEFRAENHEHSKHYTYIGSCF